MNAFDIDGVISIGIYPGPEDIIITGRSIEEKPETEKFLKSRGISTRVYYNPIAYDLKTRKISGIHKRETIESLNGAIDLFFEDDEIQIEEILKSKYPVKIVHIKHSLTNKENERHY